MAEVKRSGGYGWTTRAEQDFLAALPKLMMERKDRSIPYSDLVIAYKSYLTSMAYRRWDGLNRGKIETTARQLLGQNERAADRELVKQYNESKKNG